MRARNRALWALVVVLGLGLSVSLVFFGNKPDVAPPRIPDDAKRTTPTALAQAESKKSKLAPALDCNARATRRAAAPASFQPANVARAFFARSGASTPGLRRQIIADEAGVDPFANDDRLGRARLDRLLPPMRSDTIAFARQRRWEAALAAPTLDDFLSAARDDPAALRLGWRYLDLSSALRNDSALVHALRVRRGEMLNRIHDIPAAAFGLRELAVAIELGIDAGDFVSLLERSGVDATTTWKHHTLTREYNLAVFAAVHVRPQILRMLLAQGVALPAGMPSVLDELALALSTTQPTAAALADVTAQLAGRGERAFLPSTALRLAAVAPDISIPGLHPDAEAVSALPEVRESVRQLTALVRRAEKETEAARRITDRCRDAWIASSAGRDLASKIVQQEAMRYRQRRSMHENMEQARRMAAELSVESIEAMGSAWAAARASGDWEAVLNLLDRLPGLVPNEIMAKMPEMLLTSVLHSDAPMDVVRELIRRNGGVLPADIILTLLASDRDDALQVAAELEARGLDPGFVDADGRNAVNHVIDAFRDRRDANAGLGRTLGWLNYLASRSVSPQPAGRGLDPLDTVLFAALDDPTSATVADAVLLARVLIGAGASVRPSHREIAARINAAAPDAYAKLARAIPELSA